MDMSETASKFIKQSMPDVCSMILEFEETQEAESIRGFTTIVGGWVMNTWY